MKKIFVSAFLFFAVALVAKADTLTVAGSVSSIETNFPGSVKIKCKGKGVCARVNDAFGTANRPVVISIPDMGNRRFVCTKFKCTTDVIDGAEEVTIELENAHLGQ